MHGRGYKRMPCARDKWCQRRAEQAGAATLAGARTARLLKCPTHILLAAWHAGYASQINHVNDGFPALHYTLPMWGEERPIRAGQALNSNSMLASMAKRQSEQAYAIQHVENSL